MLRPAFHGMVLVHHACVGLYGLIGWDVSKMVDRAVLNLTDYPWIQLTIWNMAFQMLYFATCLLEAVLPTLSRGLNERIKKPLRDCIDFVFTVFVLPPSFFASVMSWTLDTVDQDHVFPSVASGIVPSWLNHGVHTTSLIVVTLEVLTSRRRNLTNQTNKTGLIILHACAFAYHSSLLNKHAPDGAWLFPLFQKTTFGQTLLFLSACHVLLTAFYALGVILNSVSWGEGCLKTDSKPGMDLRTHPAEVQNGRPHFLERKAMLPKTTCIHSRPSILELAYSFNVIYDVIYDL